MKITTKQLETERTLNHRLRIMGYIMFAFAVITMIWDLLPAADSEFEQLLLEIEEAPPPLNSYFIACVFAGVGIFCLITHWKKKNLLSSQTPPET